MSHTAKIVSLSSFNGNTNNTITRLRDLTVQLESLTSGKKGENTKHAAIAEEAFDLIEAYIREEWPRIAEDQNLTTAISLAKIAADLYQNNIYSEETGRRAVELKESLLNLMTEPCYEEARYCFAQNTGLNFGYIRSRGIGLQDPAESAEENPATLLQFPGLE